MKSAGQDGTKHVGAAGGLRGITGLLSAAHPHQHVGDGDRSFPIDDHGQQLAIHIHGPMARLAVFADFDHDHASLLARAFNSRIPMPYLAAVASGLP